MVATGGAGGDLPPLVAASLALRDRGHEITFVGDASVEHIVAPFHVAVEVLPKEVDLGPRLASVVQEAMQATAGDLAKAGPMLQRGLTVWAHDVARPLSQSIERQRPSAIVTSLFGVEAVDATCPSNPWAVVNSTFYIGPHPPRPVEEDIGPRALPLVKRYAELLEAPDLVLHATDQVFDFSFDRLPSRHHYVGPLGIWEPPRERPTYLEEPGDPWILVSISSQRQDDLALAEAALEALADAPVRVLVTLGPEHDRSELSSPPANARVEKSVSHSAVLERAVLLVSHAGHGTVMKALWQGKPMVLIPWGRDQPGAEVVPCAQASAETIGAAVRRSLTNQDMAATAARHSARLRATDPPATAAAHLESLL